MRLLTDPLHLLPWTWRYGIMLAILAGVWLHGFSKGGAGPERELAAAQAVAAATDARYRALEKEVAHAQSAFVQSWTASRDAARADWLRLKAASAGRVPVVCPEPGGVASDRGDGMEAAGAAGDRDLLPTLVGALERGEQLEATLMLCQTELRQCASLR